MATYECAMGYFLEPEDGQTWTCQPGGIWSGMNSTCLPFPTTGIIICMHVYTANPISVT